jgi:hypothetical protein
VRSNATPKSWSTTSGTEARRERRKRIVNSESMMIPVMQCVVTPHRRGRAFQLPAFGSRVVRSVAMVGGSLVDGTQFQQEEAKRISF